MTSKEIIDNNKPSKTGKNKPKRNDKGQLLPGNTANPNGRPKKELCLTSILIKELSENDGAEAVKLVRKTIKTANKGHSGIIREIFERVDGRVPQLIKIPEDTSGRVAFEWTIGKGSNGEQEKE